MPLKCTCPRCGRLHRNIDKRLLGKKFQCECGKVMRLGEAPKSSPTHQKAARTPQSAQANPQPATVSGKRSAGETPPANRSTRKRPAPNKPSVVASADRSLLPREPELPQPPETGPADPAKVENAETQNPPQSTTPVDPGKPSGNLIGSEFDDVDELIQMGQLDTDLPVQPTVIADAVPTARPVSEPSTAEPVVLDELTVMPSEIISIEDDEASFEVLDDSDEDVIEILDSDLIVDPELAIKVADSGSLPEAMPQPVIAEPVEPILLDEASHERSAPSTPAGSSVSSTPTSRNPAYQAYGPPPAVHFPDEPVVPGSPGQVAALGVRPVTGYPLSTPQSGSVSLEAVFGLVFGALAIIFGLWISFESFQILNRFMPVSGVRPGAIGRSATILTFIFGFRLLSGLALLAGASLFTINEIMRLSGSDAMPWSCLTALLGASFYLLIELVAATYGILNLSAVNAYRTNVGSSVFLIMLFMFLKSIIPIGLIVFSAIRQR